MKKISQQTGLGLIEIMMTVLLIAGCVVALVRFQNYLSYSNSVANQRSTAYELAVKQIETLRDYSALSGSNSYANIASGSSTYNGSSATYTITWTITTNTNPNYKTIDVNVTWTDRQGTAQALRLISRVAQIDPSTSSSIITS